MSNTHILFFLLDVHDNDMLSPGKGHQVLPQCVEAVDGNSDRKYAGYAKPNQANDSILVVTLNYIHKARTVGMEKPSFQGRSTPPKPFFISFDQFSFVSLVHYGMEKAAVTE